MAQDKSKPPAGKRSTTRGPKTTRGTLHAADHSIQTRTEVLGLLLTGHGVQEVADMTGVPKQTVSRWWNALTEEQRAAVADRRGEILTGMMYEFAYHGMKALIAGAKLAADPEYLRKWPPIQNEKLLGTIADKLDRIMARNAELHALSQDEDQGSPGGALPGSRGQQTITIEHVEDNTTTEIARRPEADQG